MDVLKKIPRVYLKDIVFLVLWLLYVLGPLEYIASFAPTLWSLPAIFILSALAWNALEFQLSRQRVKSQNKTIFITGCDSGFGFELAKRMSSKGFDVFAGCFFPDKEGATTLAEIPSVTIVPCDVTKEDSILNAAEFIKRELRSNGKILWGVVANAGVSLLGPLEWCSMADIQTMFDVNVFGVLRTVKAFLPLLRKSRGRFVVSSSTSATASYQQLVAYSMSKAAAQNLTDGLRRELGAHTGIYFTSIQPTFHKTPMLERTSHREIEKKFKALPEDFQREFSPRYLTKCKQEHEAVVSVLAVSDLSQTIKSFNHALTSIRPRPFYICDRPFFLYTLWPLIHHFPVESVDFMFQSFHKLSKYLRIHHD